MDTPIGLLRGPDWFRKGIAEDGRRPGYRLVEPGSVRAPGDGFFGVATCVAQRAAAAPISDEKAVWGHDVVAGKVANGSG